MGDVMIGDPGRRHREGVLVDQLLLEVLDLLLAAQLPRRTNRANHRQPHARTSVHRMTECLKDRRDLSGIPTKRQHRYMIEGNP
jgi:hypothetical protein